MASAKFKKRILRDLERLDPEQQQRAAERIEDGELRRLKRVAFAEECARLDPEAERAEAEQWLNGEVKPPEY